MVSPIEPRYRYKLRKLAEYVDKIFNGSAKGKNRKVGFTILVFPLWGENGRMNYISSGERGDMIVAMKVLIAQWEGRASAENDENEGSLPN